MRKSTIWRNGFGINNYDFLKKIMLNSKENRPGAVVRSFLIRRRIKMEELFFYHVISDIPKKVGEHILLDDKHPNGVHKRVYEELERVNDIYANPDKYKDKELPHKVDVALRELALEKVRKEKFPDYPSRMASLYVSKSYEEAERWGDYFAKIGRPTYAIAKIRVTGRIFEGDAYKCFDGCADENDNLKMAERYWQNESNV